MSEYICFFHPRVKGIRPEDKCAACGRSFDFPTKHAPIHIDGFRVLSVLGRGFYSVAYLVEKRSTGVRSVLKVTPAQAYEYPDPTDGSRGGYGDRRDFATEQRLHNSVKEAPHIVSIIDWDRTTADFGGTELGIFWSQLEAVDGESLEDVAATSLTAATIAQIAKDYLEFLQYLGALGISHNDLHPGNAILTRTRVGTRRGEFDPSVELKILDLGSASKDRREDEGHLSDIEYVSELILSLTDAEWPNGGRNRTARDTRLLAQLRKVAQFYRGGDWNARQPRPEQMLHAVNYAFQVAVDPARLKQIQLMSVDEYYNAQHMPAEFARSLFYQPNPDWARRLTTPGPQLLLGMRGCGKTLLLRSLEWGANALVGPGETPAQAASRLAEQRQMGLWVSCAHLVRGPRERIGADSMPRLFLAYAREATRAVLQCETFGIGRVNYSVVDELGHLVASVIPYFELPDDPQAASRLEVALDRAILMDPPADVVSSFPALEVFTRLAKVAASLVDVWQGHLVLFMLDDVSKRYVREGDLNDLLAQLCLKSEHFGFKISTETQTQLMYLPSGKAAIEGRDYQVFNLGAAVLEELKQNGADFVNQVLYRRNQLIPSLADRLPSATLENQSLMSIAQNIREVHGAPNTVSRKRAYRYGGLTALSRICVGDIGDVVQLYRAMLARKPRGKISIAEQSAVLMDESASRLMGVIALGGTRYAHTAAFGTASHNELIARLDRVRQYSDVFIEFDGSDEALFNEVMALVDDGVFVITGFHQRTKNVTVGPVNQISLRYRKLLGLSFGIPLANRDRFELTGPDVSAWVTSPTSDQLTRASSAESAWVLPWEPEDEDTEIVPPTVAVVPDSPKDSPMLPLDAEDVLTIQAFTQSARTPRTAKAREVPFTGDSLPWSEAAIVTAAGFEDRATAIWEELSRTDRACVTSVILDYENHDRLEEVLARAGERSVDVVVVSVDSRGDPTAGIDDILSNVPNGLLVIDVSCMTKPLIYLLTMRALERGLQTYIFHASAAVYEPDDSALTPALELINQGDFERGLGELNLATAGEGTSFVPIRIGNPLTESGVDSFLAAFVTLKQRRLESLLSSLSYDRLLGMRTIHSRNERGVQSLLIDRATSFLIDANKGEQRKIGAMDLQAAHDCLLENYLLYCLDGRYAFKLALTGTKMQTVGCGMFGAVAGPHEVYYAATSDRASDRFTHGVGETSLFELELTTYDSVT